MIGLAGIGRVGLQNLRAAARGVRWDELFSGFPGVAHIFDSAAGLTQDRGGLTPVTAAAQSIGLAHDYARASSGWVSGTELVTNGGFDADLSSWQNTAGAFVWSSGSAQSTGVAGDLLQTATLSVRVYVAEFTISSSTGSGVFISFVGQDIAFFTNGTHRVVRACVNALSTQLFRARIFAGSGGTIDNISVREITGNPLIAPTDARRPTWGSMANGLPCSVWDGTRAMATAAAVDFSSTDQITLMAAVRCTADGATQVIAEMGAPAATGFASLFKSAINQYNARSAGSVTVTAASSAFVAPDGAILVFRARISTDYLELLRNGTQIATSAADQGAGNYGNHILNIGARNAASPSLHFNGNICRIAAIGGNIGAEREAAMLGLLARDFATS